MTTTDTTIAALCAAIDAGDDTALGPLADALEEQGDPRAAGLRVVAGRGKRPAYQWGGRCRWYAAQAPAYPAPEASLSPWAVSVAAFRRLAGGEAPPDTERGWVEYGSPLSAYLALAAALAR